MGAQIEHTVTIARPVKTVYQHFLDLDQNASEPGVESTWRRSHPVRRGLAPRSASAT